MVRRSPGLMLALLLAVSISAFGSTNVVIAEESICYRLLAGGNSLETVKMVRETVYEATRASETIIAVAHYNDHVSIDKAKAPGVKPIYKSWEDESMFYTGSRICALPIDLEKGKKVKAVFEQTYKSPEQFGTIFLASPYFTRRSSVVIKVPLVLAGRVRVRAYDLPREWTVERVDVSGGVEYRVVMTDREAFKSEEYAPSPSVSAPRLVVTGMFSDQSELYSFLRGFLPEHTDAGGPVASLARELTKGMADKREMADTITAWVRQNIRYVAVEHGEYAYRPASPESVLSDKYGDCKGMAALIKDMLCHSGIDGRMVWIGTKGAVSTRWDSVPSLSSGNHMIAAAVLADTVLFLDGTVACGPKGYIQPSLRGQLAMVEAGDHPLLIEVPDIHAVCDTRMFKGSYKIEGSDLSGFLEYTLGGVFRIGFVSLYDGADARSCPKILSRYLAYPKKNATCADAELVLASPTSNVCVVRGNIADRGAAKRYGDNIFIDLQPLRLPMDPVNLKDRKRGVELPYHYRYDYDYTVELPEGYEAQLPEKLVVDTPWFEAYINYSVENGVLHCRARMATGQRLDATIGECGKWNDAVKALRRISDTKIALKPLNQ